MALAKKRRLSKKDVNRLFKRGKTVKNSFFFIRFLKNDAGYLRVAVVVPAKISKKATARNRIRRVLVEAVRSGHFLEKSYDLAIVATLDIVGKHPKEINRELEQAINKIISQ
ncbi:MAG: ribonuclease P protein component [Candidatus Yanofskybacteria bacterium]|nr:ribonuclease P protein component [Candidatus Yanofskybacteria bacterium]